MNPPDPADLLRRMGALAAMPADDPSRRRLEREIAESGDWAETAWRETLDLDARLRVDLRRSLAPEHLLAGLRSVPERAQLPWFLQWRGRAAAAAALAGALLLAFAASWGWRGPGEVSAPERVRAFAHAVLADHLDPGELDLDDDASALERELSRRLGFEVTFPALPEGWRLAGGRVCELNGHAVAYSRWSAGAERALLVFRAADYRLPETIEPFTLELEAAGRPYQVRLWTRRGLGYATVEATGSP